EFLEEFLYGIGGMRCLHAGTGREKARRSVTAEARSRPIGIALVLTQIQIDAAVEGPTKGVVQQDGPVIGARGVVAQVGGIPHPDLGLGSSRLVHYIDFCLPHWG